MVSQPERKERNSFRCPATHDQDAILIVKGKEMPVRFLDESREGVGLLCDERPCVEEGDEVELHTSNGGFRLEVVKVRPYGSQYRLGLRRLAELPSAGPRASIWKALFHDQSCSTEGAGKSRYFSFTWCFWMTVGVAAACLLVRWMLTGYQPKPVTQTTQHREMTRQSFVPTERPKPTFVTSPYSLLSVPEPLHLSDAQRTKIDQIVERAVAAAPEIRRVCKTGSVEGLSPRATVRLNCAMVEIMSVLDEGQRQQWRNLVSSP